MRYRATWTEIIGRSCEIEADSPEEAKEKILRGESIEGTQDSHVDDAKINKRSVYVEEIP